MVGRVELELDHVADVGLSDVGYEGVSSLEKSV